MADPIRQASARKRAKEAERRAAAHLAEAEAAAADGRLEEFLADLPSIPQQVAEAREAAKRRA